MPRILIADDNSNIQKMVTLALHDAGIDVVSVSNGGAAIRILPETAPDLVLADVFMPVRSGYEVCEFIKHEPRFSHVPVVLLVGAFDPLDESEAQRVSADGILKKPFIPPDPLINLVKTLLAKSLNERPEPASATNGGNGVHEPPSTRAADVPSPELAEPPEELAVPSAAPDFGAHEETLAFGSLLEMAGLEPAAEAGLRPESSPAAADSSEPQEIAHTFLGEHNWGDLLQPEAPEDEEQAEGLNARNEREFQGADLPDMDEDAPAKFVAESFVTPAARDIEIHGDASLPGTEPSFELVPDAYSQAPEESAPELTNDFGFAGVSGPRATEPEPHAATIPAMAPATEAPMPWQPELPTGELKTLAPAATAEVASMDSSAAWPGPVVPVFPGSEKLWASPPAAPVAGSPELHGHLEAALASGPLSGPILELAAVDSSSFEKPAVALDEIGAEGRKEDAAAGGQLEMMKPEMTQDAAANAGSSPELAHLTDSVKPAAAGGPDPALIEAVVTRIVERMQPRVIEVVTQEILRPLVEALVRREINKSS